MTRQSRLARLLGAQKILKARDTVELASRQAGLADVAVERDHVLRSLAGTEATEQAWLAAATRAPAHTARRLAAAQGRVQEQSAQLRDSAAACEQLARLHAAAVARAAKQHVERELHELIDRMAATRDDSVGQD